MFLQSERTLSGITILETQNMRCSGVAKAIYRRAATMLDYDNADVTLREVVIRANADGTEKFTGLAYETKEKADWLTLITDCEMEVIVNGDDVAVDDKLYLGASDNIDQDLNIDPTNRMKVGWVSGKSLKTGMWKVRITTKIN